MSRIFWDTNIYIYLFEAHPSWGGRIQHMRQRMRQRNDVLLTSWITLGELQVKPYQLGQIERCEKYRSAVLQSSQMISFAEDAERVFVQLRAQRVGSADAMQLACASAAQVHLFITNDERLHSLIVPNIDFIVGLDRVPY